MDKHTVIKLSKYEDRILETMWRWEDIPTTDLQGIVQAIVLQIYNQGKHDQHTN